MHAQWCNQDIHRIKVLMEVGCRDALFPIGVRAACDQFLCELNPQ